MLSGAALGAVTAAELHAGVDVPLGEAPVRMIELRHAAQDEEGR